MVFRAKRQYFKPPRSRLGFREETQNYAKRNSFFFTSFVYRITSMIKNQRFLQMVENIIIRLISDNKGSVITTTRCLCALSIVCLLVIVLTTSAPALDITFIKPRSRRLLLCLRFFFFCR